MRRLIDLLCGVRFETEFDLGSVKVSCQSLWKEEEVEILRRVQGLDYLGQLEALKVPTLARTLVKIDGVPLVAFPEIQDILKQNKNFQPVDAVEKYLGTFDGGVIDSLYLLYLKLKEERDKEREKNLNFTQALKAGLSTESVTSTESPQEK